MKITIFAAGSRGDIQPCVALSRGLEQAGYRVRLAAPENFAGFAGEHGVDFAALGGDIQAVMAGETGREFMQTGGGGPLKSIRAMHTMLRPIVRQMTRDAYAACREADGIVCLGVLSAFGRPIAQALRIPIVQIEPTPLLPTRAFAAPAWPVQRNLGGLHNYVSGAAMLRLVWLWYRPFVNEFRRELGLPPETGAGSLGGLRSTPLLGAYSPELIPRPADWPASAHVGGYLFLEHRADWQPPAELRRFLEAGDPPVYIGFGSMAGRSPEQLAGAAAQALADTGQRGLLLTGWGGLRAGQVPENVFVAEAAPHGWLFPRMRAVVHHGGAGTTAEGLRAGVPTVVVPFAFDQPFWGRRIRAAGLGPDPVPLKKLTTGRLAEAIQAAVSDPGIRRRAAAFGEAIRAEDGTGRAVEIVRQYLGGPEAGGAKEHP